MDDLDLSLVVALRNEQYGGDLFGRTRSFLRNVAWLSRRQRVRTEVVLVEWCPHVGQPSLAEILSGTRVGKSLRVRVVTVPTSVASTRFEQAEVIPLWIFAAKNVGVRRAQAPFVLATNPDVLFTPPLFEAIAKRALDPMCFYRADRYDVVDVPLAAGPRTQLARSRKSVVCAHLLGGSLRFDPPASRRPLEEAVRQHMDTQRAKAPTTKEEAAAHPTDWIHTNASGDFFLMHRSRWAKLRGYPEFASAGHLDSYLCVIAVSAGLKQVAFDGRQRLYHLDHARLFEWEHAEDAPHYVVPFETFLETAKQMLERGEPEIVNDASWGLAELDLPEATIAK